MTSAIGSSTSSYTAWATTSAPRRPDPAAMAENLFSALDTSGQGYLQQTDFESAFSQLGIDDSDAASAEELFSALDADADGKLTQDELSSSMQKLADQLDSQFHQMRMSAGGMPPPPPPGAGEDQGFTQDELESMASEIGSTDSKRSSLMNSIASNFEAADADGDGRVTASEARAYEESTRATGTATASAGSENLLMKRIMQLAAAYGDNASGTLSAQVSVTA
ncbi:EF-hand domain-containing protein [Azoarcus olearius]|uniref:Calcium binding protein n=1 Tax=Azoarcus sp. (strain BH72) TaxID=418699 RepID=A1KBM7_AZOSB|nr:EF-hand domain-containing protein [Azoarcus olearius]CAL96233.1 putative calcium binding protein [Azoarcus olearius]